MADRSEAIEIRPVLHQSVTLLLRHWPVVLISLAALTEGCLLALDFVGHCFASIVTSCVSPELFSWLGQGPIEAQINVRHALDQLASYAVLATALCFLSSTADINPNHTLYLRQSPRRVAQFFARVALWWLILLMPSWIINPVYAEVAALVLPSGHMHVIASWCLYLAKVVLVTVVIAYLEVRLVLYLPVAAYSERPESLLQCWRQTHRAPRNLFLIFLIIGGATTAVQILLSNFGGRIVETRVLAADLARTSLVSAAYLARALPAIAGFILTAVAATLLCGVVRILVFRKLARPDERMARIFE